MKRKLQCKRSEKTNYGNTNEKLSCSRPKTWEANKETDRLTQAKRTSHVQRTGEIKNEQSV
jgi:hypothetical protein